MSTLLFLVLSLAHAAGWVPSARPGCAHLFTSGRSPEFSAEEQARLHARMIDPDAREDERRHARWMLGLFEAEEMRFLDDIFAPHANTTTLDDIFAANEGRAPAAPDLRPVVPGPIEPGHVEFFESLGRLIADSALLDGFGAPRVDIETQYIKIKPRSEWSEAARTLFEWFTVGIPEYERFTIAGRWIYGYFTNFELHEYSIGRAVAFTFDPVFRDFFHPEREGPPPSLAAWAREPAAITSFRPVSSHYFRASAIRPHPGVGHLLPIDVVDWERSVFRVSVTKGSATEGTFQSVHLLATRRGREAILVGGSSGSPARIARDGAIERGLPLYWERVPAQFRRPPRDLTEYRAYLAWLDTKPFAREGLTAPSARPALGSPIDESRR